MKPEELARKVFRQRAAMYATGAAHTDPQALARVVELCAPEPDWSVLDIATGAGHTALALAPHVSTVIGTDLTHEMLVQAEMLLAQRSLANVTFAVADAHALPFKDRAFQLTTCRLAAHHFSDIRRALREMKRVLCRGGRLLIDDRSVPEDDAMDACMNELDRLHDGSHVREYRPSEWRRMLDACGFTVELVEPHAKHRPLSSLTQGVADDDVQRIHDVLHRLDARQRTLFNLSELDGQLHLNHWYVLLRARPR